MCRAKSRELIKTRRDLTLAAEVGSVLTNVGDTVVRRKELKTRDASRLMRSRPSRKVDDGVNFTLVTRFIIKRGGQLANENRPARRVDVGILFINHVGRKSAAEPARTEHRVPRKSPAKCSLRSFFASRRKEQSFVRVEKSEDGIRHVCFDCVILGRWRNKEEGGKVRRIK